MNRRHFLATLAACAPGVRVAIADTGTEGSLAGDIELLQRVFETLHPGLYRYQTPAEFAEHCATAKQTPGADASLAARYLTLSRLTAKVRCGHTYANFFNQTRTVSAQLIEPANKLPFQFIWLGDQMVVTGNPLGIDGLRRGDGIVSINGVSAREIQATLLPLIRADGSNDDKRRALLAVTGADRIETFDVMYPLMFPIRQTPFTLTVQRPGVDRALSVKVDPIDQARREAMAGKAADASTPEYWSLSFPKPSVALITMPGWAMYNVRWDWRARIAGIFEEIARRRATGLVIDLRANEGGDDCGDEIVSRLIEHELQLSPGYERRVRFRTTPAALNPYLDTWDRSFEHLGEGALDLGNGFYRLDDRRDNRSVIKPRSPHFAGKVIVLCGAQNSSATFQFIDLVRRHGLARSYGAPTGGNQRGINGGSFFFVRLPGSGIEVDLPLVGTFPREPKPDAGLTPDVRIEPTREDVAAGYDRVLERAVSDLA